MPSSRRECMDEVLACCFCSVITDASPPSSSSAMATLRSPPPTRPARAGATRTGLLGPPKMDFRDLAFFGTSLRARAGGSDACARGDAGMTR